MTPSADINISELIDNSKLGTFHTIVFTLCGIGLLMDGFDVQAIGYVAPSIVKDWHIQTSQLGPVFSAALVGLFLGSLIFSQIADRVGRRPVLILCTLLFSVFAFFTASAQSLTELITARFLGGIFMGAIMPNITALVGEYSPRKNRVAMMMIVTNGFTIGAAVGGFLSAWLVTSHGWRSVFYFGSVVPLAVTFLMLFWLPESLQFLVLRNKNPETIRHWLGRIGQSTPASARYTVAEKPAKGVPLVHLFQQGRATGTILLSIIYCMNVLNLYFLSTWLPTVATTMGYSTSTAVFLGTALQVGGAIGSMALTGVVSRFGFSAVLTSCLVVGFLTVGSIGLPVLGLAALFAVVFSAGWCIFGSQAIMNALTATFYPTDIRSTGVGWGLGISRVGGILGPLIAGELVRRHWHIESIFFAAAIPALLSAIAAFTLRWVIPTRTAGGQAGPLIAQGAAN